MAEPDNPEDLRLHYSQQYWWSDLDAAFAESAGEKRRIAVDLSRAIDLLLSDPRPYPLPITPYNKRRTIWEYRFTAGFSFTYRAEYREVDGPPPRTERHYFLLRILKVQE